MPEAPLTPDPILPIQFKTGSVVRLKTGGPVMVLEPIQANATMDTSTYAVWYEGRGFKRQAFALGQLRIVTQDELDAEKSQHAQDREREHELRLKSIEASKEVELAKVTHKQPSFQPPSIK